MKEFETVLGYAFHRPELLQCALTHSSYANEHRDRPHNERLEFLGDAVLELSASAWLYRQYPREPEGNLSRRRAALVCEASLANCARRLKLGDRLCLGKGEDKGGGREKDSLLADAMEALIGAIFLDGGFEVARNFVERQLLEPAPEQGVPVDYKTKLQEYLQQEGEISIRYRLKDESAEKELFCAEVLVEGRVMGCGYGHSKKAAEQHAAHEALIQVLPQ